MKRAELLQRHAGPAARYQHARACGHRRQQVLLGMDKRPAEDKARKPVVKQGYGIIVTLHIRRLYTVKPANGLLLTY